MPSISVYRIAVCEILDISALTKENLNPFILENRYNLLEWLNSGESTNLRCKNAVVSLYHWILEHLHKDETLSDLPESKEDLEACMNSDRLMGELWNDTAFLRDDEPTIPMEPTEFRDTLKGFRVLAENVINPMARLRSLGGRMLGLCERLALRHPLALILRKVD